MGLTYILIDFENVQPAAEDLKLIRGEDYRVRVFYGSHQSNFGHEMVTVLQPLGQQAEYIKCERKGKNALDFRIAFFLGGIAKEFEPNNSKPAVVVISKDTDLDTLLDHLRSLGFDAKRTTTVREAMSVDKAESSAPAKVSKRAKPTSASDSLQTLLAYLVDHPKNRPAKIETLKNHLTNIFGGAITEQQKNALIAELVSKGFAAVTGKKIEYKIPSGKN
jgi:PIN domain